VDQGYPEFLKVIALDVCDSTNNYLRKRWEELEACLPLLATAAEQTGGRGRDTRTWLSSRGLGLYSTFAFSMPASKKVNLLPLAAGICVIEVLGRAIDIPWGLKWPNDVVYEGKKIAGILIETFIHRRQAGCLVGIGINVNHGPADFPPELKDRATSLSLIGGQKFPITAINIQLAHGFFNWLSILESPGAPVIVDKANFYSRFLLGQKIAWHHRDTRVEGIFSGIHPDGGLILEAPDKTRKIYYSGEILDRYSFNTW
jgi:BirA family biotin operon repressor/biotin-[acetyl-CoA-carboxylase] ligase